ncbi:glycosyltransferase [Luteimicrobium subarcticum]|uniref:GT2 family glycosyltransferase n=1 Tax=Luteimicrobium subarcticum TaxID=620910 RepID=A0A2M8WTG3_9MICO|nr:glycosyltransferase [Luteimicrobium subarcticum]PJI94240.1 GT2 family glycosyltransferase [Luteimicrobium subarcticum]
MTETSPTPRPTPGVPDDRSPDRDTTLPGVSPGGARPGARTVTAVLVTRGATPWLRRTLAAVHDQVHAPDRVVVVDVTAARTAVGFDDLQLGDAHLVPAPGARSFGDGVSVALGDPERAVPDDGWLWLLHDDSVPAPDALDRLLVAVEHSRTIAVAGPKQRRWSGGHPDAPTPAPAPRLIEVGVTTSHAGRRTVGFEPGEIDQGQHDGTEDVLAVGLAGALVRHDVWTALGGTDPDLGPFGDGLDLCRRARRAGHRVVVVPQAVVEHAQLGLRGADPREGDLPDGSDDPTFAARRRSEVRLRLTSCAAGLLPLLAVWLVVAAPLHAMYRLALKQPGRARDELLAPLLVLVRPASLWRARRRGRGTATLPRRALRPLETPWRDVRTERRWRRMAATEQRRATYAPSELERAELAQLAVRRRVVGGVVVVALVVLTALVFGSAVGPLLGGGQPVGGALLPLAVPLGELWQAVTGGWVPVGYGASAPADPVHTVLLGASVLTLGHTQLALSLLVLLSFVVAGTGAWCAAGTLTRWNAARAAAAAVWVAAPPLLLAVEDGRLGPLLAHAALPWFVVALLRGLGVAQDDRVAPAVPRGRPQERRARDRTSLGALACAALVLVPVVAGAPVLLVAGAVVAVVTALLSWRRGLRTALVLAPAVVFLAPFWWYVARTWADRGLGWHLLVASPGPAVPFTPPQPWEAALGWPRHASTADLPAALGDGAVAAVLPFVLVGAVALVALVAVVRSRRRAGVVVAWVVVLLGLAVALLGAGTTVATSTAGLVRGWPGAGTSLVVAGLLGAALLAGPGRERLRGRYDAPDRLRTALRAAAATVALVLPAASLAAWTHAEVRGGDDPAVGRVTVSTTPVVPPVAQQMQSSSARQRVVALTPTSDGTIRYALLTGDGTQLTQSSTVAEGTLLGAALDGRSVAGTPEAEVATLVADLAGRGVAPASSTTAARLAGLGVGGVLLTAPAGRADERGTATTRSALVARVDTEPGLTRVTEGQPSVLWRVTPTSSADRAPAWATLRTPGGRQLAVLPADGPTVRTRLDAAGDERRVVLADRAAAGWHARLGGVALHRVADGWRQEFVVPPGASGTLTVRYDMPHRAPWLAGSALVLLVVVLLALPVRRRKVVLR